MLSIDALIVCCAHRDLPWAVCSNARSLPAPWADQQMCVQLR